MGGGEGAEGVAESRLVSLQAARSTKRTFLQLRQAAHRCAREQQKTVGQQWTKRWASVKAISRGRRVAFDVKRCQEDTTPARRRRRRAPARDDAHRRPARRESPRPPPQVSPPWRANSGWSCGGGTTRSSSSPVQTTKHRRRQGRPRGPSEFGGQKLVVVTGTSSGLGRKTARALVRTGKYHVVGAVRDVDKMAVVAEIEDFDTDRFTAMECELNSSSPSETLQEPGRVALQQAHRSFDLQRGRVPAVAPLREMVAGRPRADDADQLPEPLPDDLAADAGHGARARPAHHPRGFGDGQRQHGGRRRRLPIAISRSSGPEGAKNPIACSTTTSTAPRPTRIKLCLMMTRTLT